MRILFRRCFLWLTLYLSYTSTFGQPNPADFAEMSDFLPPSPNAAALGKYGGISISQNTGLPNITIPLISFNSHQLSFQASLQYNSGGIKVEEIASRVGMGWVLDAGGVVNRTVMGVADELATSRSLLSNPNTSSWQFHEIIKSISSSPPTSGYDGQADIFSFNFAGYTGRFVLDEQMNPVLLPHTNLKIETNFFNAQWNIKITSPEGLEYFFGGTDATEESKRETAMNCGKNYDQYTPTAWYLNKILHPNGDYINFSYTGHDFEYDNGRSQTHYSTPILSGCSPSSCPTLQNTNCEYFIDVKSKLISEIQSSSHAKIRFYYTTRQDCLDKLINKIELIDKNSNTIIDTYDLLYTYYGTNKIPFLTDVKQKSSTILKGKEYQLQYYSPGNRPDRQLTPQVYAQDHWGYYNGKVTNSNLLQKPSDIPTQQKFPFATADRTPVFASTVTGMLYSIKYPTGGKDVITYEANVYGTNTVTGGVRVKTVVTDDDDADGVNKPIVKRYYYSPINNLSTSSALIPALPNYLKIFRSRNFCNPGYSYCEYAALYSNSLNNLFDFSSSPVSYTSVIESHGANFENGGIEYKFTGSADAKGVILLNDEIINAPYSNFGYLNGKLIEKNEFKKSGSVITYLKKTINTYHTDPRKSIDRINWVANRKYPEQGPISVPPNPPASWELEAIDVMRYDLMSRWVYLQSTTDIEYDQNGSNPKTTVTNFYYDDEDNLMLSRTEVVDSKNDLIKNSYKYPHDYSGTAVYDAMITRHIIAPVVELKSLVNTGSTDITTSIIKTHYELTPTYNLALPKNVQKTITGSVFTEGSFDKYDEKGNLLQFTGKDGIKVCYVWGYGYRYVIAKVIGTDYSTISTTINISSLQNITDESTLRNTLNALRSIPGTLATTYTHKPLVGMSSESDPNNRTTYYYYDELGRLVLIKDKDEKILKKICYNYHGQTEYCNIYVNEQKSQVFYRNDCASGYAGSAVTYLVPAGKYISSVSLADANAKAQAEITVNGQTYANTIGTCQLVCNTSNCSGINKKCINNICETGVKIITSSVQIGPHLYECTYHYEWSDGSWSQNYTEQSPTPCFLVE